MRVSLIAAVADNDVIGRGNELPWRLSSDLKRFKKLTLGHHLVVGRKTFESIGRALPERRMLVVSRGRPRLPPEAELVGSLAEAIERAAGRGEEELFVGGGAQIYAAALPVADRLYLTRVHGVVEGDTHFPPWRPDDWRLVGIERFEAGDKDELAHSFAVYDRRAGRDERTAADGS